MQNLDAMPQDIVMPDESLGLRCLAFIRQQATTDIEATLAQLQERALDPSAFQAHSYLFLAYAGLEQIDEAFDWLEQAFGMKSAILLLAFTDPLVASLREDARYGQFLEKMYQLEAQQSVQSTTKAPLLEETTAVQHTAALKVFMEEERPYLDPGLSLRSLAARVQIHPNQLSWLLNNRLQQNFNEFVNSYRIAQFKQLALDPANSHISLLGLAYESGFNSKTVFNTYFKKQEGMTPGAFLKAQGGSEL